MLVKSQAIVLHKLRYNDADSIVCLYSKEYGRISYLTSNHKKKNHTVSQASLQPLSIIEYEGDHKGSRELQRLKETHLLYSFSGIPFDPVKNGISFFLAEILYRVLNEAEDDGRLFDFLLQSIQILDLSNQGTANFHLVFLCKLSLFLGFYPNVSSYQPRWYFDMLAGEFAPTPPSHHTWIPANDSQLLANLLHTDFHNMNELSLEHTKRVELLHYLIEYYRLHLSDFPTIRSLDILQECFGE